jgi:hypothetical protein
MAPFRHLFRIQVTNLHFQEVGEPYCRLLRGPRTRGSYCFPRACAGLLAAMAHAQRALLLALLWHFQSCAGALPWVKPAEVRGRPGLCVFVGRPAARCLTRTIASLPPPPGRRRWAGGKPPEGAAVVRRKMATSGGEEAAAAAPAPGAPATGQDTTPGWEVAVRPLLSASYSAFEMKELPQLVASVIERYRAAAPAGGVGGEGRTGRFVSPLCQGIHPTHAFGTPGRWERERLWFPPSSGVNHP